MGLKHRRNELATHLGLGAELAAQTEFYMHFSLPCLGHFLTSLGGDSKRKPCLRASKSFGLTGLSYGSAISLFGVYPRHLEIEVHTKTCA